MRKGRSQLGGKVNRRINRTARPLPGRRAKTGKTRRGTPSPAGLPAAPAYVTGTFVFDGEVGDFSQMVFTALPADTFTVAVYFEVEGAIWLCEAFVEDGVVGPVVATVPISQFGLTEQDAINAFASIGATYASGGVILTDQGVTWNLYGGQVTVAA
jgi:hypothetical protein